MDRLDARLNVKVLANSSQGEKMTPEQVEVVRARMEGSKNPMAGKKRTEEEKRLIGEARKGKKNPVVRERQGIPVIVSKGGEEAREYGSLREATLELGLNRSAIRRGLKSGQVAEWNGFRVWMKNPEMKGSDKICQIEEVCESTGLVLRTFPTQAAAVKACSPMTGSTMRALLRDYGTPKQRARLGKLYRRVGSPQSNKPPV